MDKSSFRVLSPFWDWYVMVASLVGLFLVLNQIFYLGVVILQHQFLYMVLLIFLPLTFVTCPAYSSEPRGNIPWYDYILIGLSIISLTYLAIFAYDIVLYAWLYNPPQIAAIMSAILWLICIEATRRSGGTFLGILAGLLSFYPLVAPYMPYFIAGQGYTFLGTASFHAMSTQSIVGIIMNIFSMVILGFILFGVAIQVTGGGDFFMNIALSTVGRTRGGSAKMAIVGSALFGSISGSVMANVILSGSITIPMMKRSGYPPHVAAAIESCSSTGGVIMPPVMGATAFIMASILGVPYATVMIIALVPSILYFFSLFLQVDLFAAANDIGGVPLKKDLSYWEILRKGWFFILSLVVLLLIIVYLRLETKAPYVAMVIVFVGAMIRKKRTRFSIRDYINFWKQCCRLLIQMVAIIVGISLILGSLTMTGVAQALGMELVYFVGDNGLLLLIIGALTSFIFGIGMTITAAYVILAVILAPSLTQMGYNVFAVHMFILYWGMISFITPPVALAVYGAAPIAGADGFRTSIEAIKFGMVIYFIPFFMVLNPAMLFLEGTICEQVTVIGTSLIGIILITGGLQNYLLGSGKLPIKLRLPLRLVLILAGILIGIPVGPNLTEQWLAKTNLAGMFLCLFALSSIWYLKKKWGNALDRGD